MGRGSLVISLTIAEITVVMDAIGLILLGVALAVGLTGIASATATAATTDEVRQYRVINGFAKKP